MISLFLGWEYLKGFSYLYHKTSLMKYLLILCLGLLSPLVFGQSVSLKDMELDLFNTASKMEINYRGDSDSLTIYSDLFTKKMDQYIKENPETFNYPFKKLVDESYLHINTSGLLRIYSWDTWMGGTMKQFNNIYQYNSGPVSKIVSETYDNHDIQGGEDLYDPGTFCSAIYTINTINKFYYIVITNGIYTSKDSRQSVECYAIENRKLNRDVKLFKTSEGMTSHIDVDFDFFSVVDRPERPLKLIKYNETKKLLYIPIVYENGKVTKKFIEYKFNGQYFERQVTANKKKGKAK